MKTKTNSKKTPEQKPKLNALPTIWEPHPGAQVKFLQCPVYEALIGGSRGGGKAQPLDSPVLTPWGFKPMRDIKVGSKVLSPDGTQSTVIGVYPQGEQVVYRVTFADTSTTYCTGEHLWFSKMASSKAKLDMYAPLGYPGKIYTTEQLKALIELGKDLHPLIPCPEPARFSMQFPKSDYEFDPYLLGLLLGDGILSREDVCFHSADQELADYVQKFGFYNTKSTSVTDGIFFQIRRNNPLYRNLIKSGLRGTKSDTKFIPKKYLYAAPEVRLAVLQGLMDTDGEAHEGKAYYSTVSKQLLDDVRFLVHSLGGWATVIGGESGKQLRYRIPSWPAGVYKDTKRGWGLYIRFPEQKELFRLKRKRDIATNYMHGRLVRKIVSIQECGKQEVQCIKVDNPSGLYMTDDFIVTHNTDVLLMDFLQGVGVGYGAAWKGIIFREQYTQLTDLINKCHRWIKQIFPDAKYNGTEHTWRFKTGEALYLRYMRTPADYWSYHGHEYCVYHGHLVRMGDGSYKAIKDIKVGELVATLQGPQPVTKVYEPTLKDCVGVSVYDDCQNLIGTQYHSVTHRCLTNDKWRSQWSSDLSQTWPLLLTLKLLYGEVQKLLHGVSHILEGNQIYAHQHSSALGNQLSAFWYSQISLQYIQYLQVLLTLQLQLCTYLANLSPSSEVERVLGISCIELEDLQKAFLLSLSQSTLLQAQALSQNLYFSRRLTATQPRAFYKSSQLSFCGMEGQIFSQLGLELLQGPYAQLLDRCIYDALCYAQICSGILESANCCSSRMHGALFPTGIKTSLAELQLLACGTSRNHADSPQDVLCTSLDGTHGHPTQYTHPYSGELQGTQYALDRLHYKSFSSTTPLLCCDIEVQSSNHYLTLLGPNLAPSAGSVNLNNARDTSMNTGHTMSAVQHLVNQNCWCVHEDTLVLLADGRTIPAKDIQVDDMVQTLEGPKPVLRKVQAKKPCVSVSFFDGSGQLFGTQIQGEEHLLLSTDGMHTVSTLGSSHEVPQFSEIQTAWLGYESLHNDGQPHQGLGTSQGSVPSLGVSAAPISCLSDMGATGLPRGSSQTMYYTHPYSKELRQCTQNLVSTGAACSYSPVGDRHVVDLTVEGASHYITELNRSQLVSSVGRKYVVNKNCGWEELTNWATDECYKIMMSCNRSSDPNIPRRYRATCNPSGPGHCVPYGDVLTPTGWKDIKDICIGDPVFTVDQMGAIKEAKVHQIHQEHYTGPMVKVSKKALTIECTPQHSLPKVGGVVGNRGSLYTLLPFKDLPGESHILRSGSWAGASPKEFHVPQYPTRNHRLQQPQVLKYDDYAELMGWFLSEGHTSDMDKAFGITQVRRPQRALIEGLLNRCGFVYGVSKRGYLIHSPYWWAYLAQFGKCRDKHIPVELKNSSAHTLQILFDALVGGDGTWYTKGRSGEYYTTSKQLCSDVCEVALKLGYVIGTRERQRENRVGVGYTVRFKKTKLKSGTIHTGNHRYNVGTTKQSCDTTTYPYDGAVYCIGVPDTHTFIIRQQGSVWVSGNSWVRQRFIDPAPPLHIIRDQETGRNRVFIPSQLDENLTLLGADPEYKNTLLVATKDDPVKYKAWVLGDWDIVVGGFFSDVWDPKKHVLKKFPLPKSWNIVRSFDWGSSKPWSVSYIAECNGEQPDHEFLQEYGLPYFPKGSCIVVDELYGWDGTVDTGDKATSQQIAERVLEKDASILREYGIRVRVGPADTQIWEVRDGTSIAQNMTTYGLYWMRALKGSGSRISGWSLIRTMLGAAKRQDAERARLYFFEDARHHIRTIPIQQYDPKKPEDINSDLEDHCCFSGDTEVLTDTGLRTIRDLVGTTGKVLSLDGRMQAYHSCKLYKKSAQVVRVTFSDGTSVVCTPDHLFATTDGDIPAFSLTDSIRYCITSTIYQRSPTGLRAVEAVTTLTPVGVELLTTPEDVYCLTVPETGYFALSNGVVVHNCDSLRYGLTRKFILMKRTKVRH